MACTGLFLSFFVIAHLIGNLQIFLGPEWLNSYAEHLEELPALLWPARILLIIFLTLHLTTAIKLAMENKSARPIGYGYKKTVQATMASRTMVLSGFVIFFFILFHLAHFTFDKVQPQFTEFVDSEGRHDVYSMVVLSFQSAWVSVTYLLAVFFLGLHLSHGFQSALQTFGLIKEGCHSLVKKASQVLAFLIFIAYASIPVSCWLGILKPLATLGG